MKRMVVVLCFCFLLLGCDSLRFAPTELQKQNAWLHNRTTAVTAQCARAEEASARLQALSGLSELQSRSFVSYCGLPKEFPPAETAEDILRQSNFELAQTALAESADRPDPWRLADAMFELAIGISALLGGVYGTRAVQFLKQARVKSQALKEIVAGNELLKKTNNQYASAFKDAHRSQSPQTRQVVAEMKTQVDG